MSHKRLYWMGGVAAAAITAALASSPVVFVPDATFHGSTLSGWHTLGQAKWRAENGEIVGTPSGGGGWLVLDKSYQDLGVFASFRCGSGCKTGILLRAEKTADGMKGIYVSLTDGDLASYRVTLDANGRETSREALRPGGGQMRIAPPPNPNAAGRGGAGRGRGGMPTNLVLKAPVATYSQNDWNHIEIILDANIVRSFFNDGNSSSSPTTHGLGGVAEEAYGRYGPIALYAGGTGEVRFKDVAYKDLNSKTLPKEQVSPNYTMQRIDDFYYAWSAAAADVNRDGILDVVAGPYYWLGPNYTERKEIYLAQTVNPSTAYPNDCMQAFAYDFTGDGWPDELCMGAIGQPLHLYVNPRGESRRWDKYDVTAPVLKEVSLLKDIDGDGKPEYIYGGEDYLRYAKPDPANPTGKWIVHTISEKGPWGAGHGLGVGDINGDGRMDIVDPYGWWEQPPAGSHQELWTYHPYAFGTWTGHASPGGAEMAIYDVNGDGLNDVVTVLQAHGWGMAWFEQKREGGQITFVKHMIIDDFFSKSAGDVHASELHGTGVADLDGDGIPDFLAGKRFWSHLDDYTDPDPYGAPVLYAFHTRRNPNAPGGAEFVPELIHNRSGAGNAVEVVDLNRDGAPDIITSTDRGTFIFWGKPKGNRARSGSN